LDSDKIYLESMVISLIHPSRGRAGKALTTINDWRERSSGKVLIEHILSVDNDDPHIHMYLRFTNAIVVTGDNKDVVEATNRGAARAKGDILVYLSDDFTCPKDWDLHLTDIFDGVTCPQLLKVDDCLQSFNVPVLTIPIMNRALFEKLKYFWHPNYKSMFVDEDLYWTCKNNNWLIEAPGLKFPHEHCSIGKAENDETYKRSAGNWNQGKAMFAQRKAAGFPL
jgi:hypothetical protein